MMKKKIFALFLLAAFSCISVSYAAGVELTDIIEGVITVSGETKDPGDTVNILIIKSTALPEEAEKDISLIAYQSAVKADDEGRYSRNIILPCGDEGYMEYAVYTGEDKEPQTVIITSLDKKKELAEKILSKDKETIRNILQSEQDRKILGIDNDIIKEADPLKVSEKIAEREIDIDINTDDRTSAENIEKLGIMIMEEAFVDCLNNNNTSLISGDELLYDNILDTDKEEGVTVFECYKSLLNSAGKKNVQNGLTGKNFSGISELRQHFAKLVLFNGIHNDVSAGGYGHIAKFYTDENITYAGLGLDSYKKLADKTTVASKLVSDTGITFDNFEKKIEEYSKNISSQSGGGSNPSASPSTVPGSGSKASSSGISVSAPAKEENADKTVFDDIDDVLWAKDAILALYEKGIINGTGGTKFEPSKNLTREQAVKIICEMMHYPESGQETGFEDIVKDSWYEKYINSAAEQGIVKGISDNEFGVGQNITREDFIVIVYRSLGVDEEYWGIMGFSDSGEIADYAKDAVGYFVEKGIISGYPDNTFRPGANITRAEAAKIIYGMIG